MEQSTYPSQVNQREQLPKPKKIIWILSFSIIILIGVIVAELYIGINRFTNQNRQNISETNNETKSEQLTQAPIDKVSEKILYKSDNDLVLYNATTKVKSVVLSSLDLLDFDLSRDKNFIVYSLKESGFEGNSDIYLKNLTNGQTTRLTEKNNISSFNPKLFPDNNKVAYVRRVYNPTTKKLSDGEIWVINADGNINSSKKLFKPDKESEINESELQKVLDGNGKWTGEYFCISKEEIKSVKIGIKDISPNGNVMSYWQKGWAPECSGLWKMPVFYNLDGTDFLSEKLEQQNTFKYDFEPGNQEEFNWEVGKIFWFDDGSFVAGQDAPIPIPGQSTYYFDKDQNKNWEIFDSFKQDARSYDIQISINDIIKKDNTHFLVVFDVYQRSEDIKYFVVELNLGDKIDLTSLNNKNYFAVEKFDNDVDEVLEVKILNDNNIVFTKQIKENDFGLYLYNVLSGKEEEIAKSSSIIDFDL